MKEEDYLRLARRAALDSPDTSRKTGCVLALPRGLFVADCNRFPDGVEATPKRLERPAKYVFTEHAERNVIYYCARHGIYTEDLTMYLTWFPCADCARAIVQARIRELVCVEPDWTEERYGFVDSRTILQEGGVRVRFVSGKAA